MPRVRSIKPGFFTNDELAEVAPLGRLLFAGLWCIADRRGRVEDRPRKIKAECLPYDDADVDGLLSELAEHGFLLRYEADTGRFIQVLNFEKHQTPHIKEPESTIPAPCLSGACPVPSLEVSGESTIPAPPDPVAVTDPDPVADPVTREPVQMRGRSAKPSAPATSAEQDVLDSLHGLRGWPQNKDPAYDLRKIREWRKLYPDISLPILISKMDSWLAGKPVKVTGNPARVGNWLEIARRKGDSSEEHSGRVEADSEAVDSEVRAARELAARGERWFSSGPAVR